MWFIKRMFKGFARMVGACAFIAGILLALTGPTMLVDRGYAWGDYFYISYLAIALLVIMYTYGGE